MNNLKPKDPLVALMFSFLCPGLGQIYAGKIRRGILYFLIIVAPPTGLFIYLINPATAVNIHFLKLFLPFFIFFPLYVFVDAYIYAKKYNIANNLTRRITIWKKILIVVGILFFILFNPFLIIHSDIKNNLFQPFKIPVDSMKPALVKDDMVLADKSIYKKSEPKRGDLVVFFYPKDARRSFVKRLVGFPNETVEIRGGRVLINGVVISEPEIFAKIYYYNRGDYAKEGQAVKIPEDSYFVLGDNSSSSHDSRYWGFVSKKYLQGKIYKIYFPVERAGPVK